MSETVERSGWRDQAYSDWHRQLQWRAEHKAYAGHYYMVDIDAVEYRHGRETVAIMELKYGEGRKTTDSQRRVLLDLARRADVPLFQVNYRYTVGAAETPPRDAGNGVEVTWDKWDTWEFKVTALNAHAQTFMKGGNPSRWVNESEYIVLLGKL